MNVSKLRELRSQIGNTFTGQLIDALLEDNDVYPPESPDSSPRVDRSLRGPCAVTTEDGTILMYANDRGLSYYSDAAPAMGDMPWNRVEESNITVCKLTPEDIGFRVRRWDEWTDEERSEFKELMRKTGFVDAVADKAIDIALRGTHE